MNDYLRPPSKWNSVWKNFTKLMEFANTKRGKRIKVRVTTVNQLSNALHIADFWRFLHEYQLTQDRGIGLSTNQLIEPEYYSMAHSPQWLREQQAEQIQQLLNDIKDSPYYEQFAEPLTEIIAFGQDPEHQYNPERMAQYVKITENYDKFRGDDIMDVAPEFSRIKKDLNS